MKGFSPECRCRRSREGRIAHDVHVRVYVSTCRFSAVTSTPPLRELSFSLELTSSVPSRSSRAA
jgi:hypothetical protein